MGLVGSICRVKFPMGPKMGRPAPFVTSYKVVGEDKSTNNRTMFPTLKNNAAAGCKGQVKIELLKGTGLLPNIRNLVPRVFAIFEMVDGGEEPGTRCMFCHVTHFIFVFASLFPRSNMAAGWIPYLIP